MTAHAPTNFDPDSITTAGLLAWPRAAGLLTSSTLTSYFLLRKTHGSNLALQRKSLNRFVGLHMKIGVIIIEGLITQGALASIRIC
jgi:hypothetical protein